MIFAKEVKTVAESFIRDAIEKKFPKTCEAILANPKLPEWYEKISQALSKQSLIEGKPTDYAREIRRWAAGYVEHCLKKTEDN